MKYLFLASLKSSSTLSYFFQVASLKKATASCWRNISLDLFQTPSLIRIAEYLHGMNVAFAEYTEPSKYLNRYASRNMQDKTVKLCRITRLKLHIFTDKAQQNWAFLHNIQIRLDLNIWANSNGIWKYLKRVYGKPKYGRFVWPNLLKQKYLLLLLKISCKWGNL